MSIIEEPTTPGYYKPITPEEYDLQEKFYYVLTDIGTWWKVQENNKSYIRKWSFIKDFLEERNAKLTLVRLYLNENKLTYEPNLSDVKETIEENDPVNHPKHYTSHPSGVECIDIVRHMSFNLGNTIKYIWRDGIKDSEAPLQDLKKALWYLQDEIALREKSNEAVQSM